MPKITLVHTYVDRSRYLLRVGSGSSGIVSSQYPENNGNAQGQVPAAKALHLILSSKQHRAISSSHRPKLSR